MKYIKKNNYVNDKFEEKKRNTNYYTILCEFIIGS